jgi:replicative DNA helicase
MSSEGKAVYEDVGAEMAVLGSMLKDPEAHLAVMEGIDDEAVFSDKSNRIIYREIQSLLRDSDACDIIVVSDSLRKSGELDNIGGYSYLVGLADIAQTPGFARRYARIVLECYVERVARDATLEGHKPEEVVRLKEQAQAKLDRLAGRSLPLADYLQQKQERDKSRKKGEPLGLRLSKFSDIQKNTDGIQSGFYIIAAHTNVGKTALLTNLFLDLLSSNEQAKGIYFSFDDNKDVIIDRFLGIETGLKLNDVKRPLHHETQQRLVEEAYDKLRQWADKGRLHVRDLSEVSHVDALNREIRANMDVNLVVAIDGLYNIEVDASGGVREQNIDRAQKVKAIVDQYRIPVIVTGELRKRDSSARATKKPSLDDLMETSKFLYNANLIWLLYPPEDESAAVGKANCLTLEYAKNKLSSYRKTQLLTFFTDTGKVGQWSGREDSATDWKSRSDQ